jgi:hypothetical protein
MMADPVLMVACGVVVEVGVVEDEADWGVV